MKLTSAVAFAAAAVLSLTSAQNTSLPRVDIGYEIHQAIAFNQTGQYYNFSNIRYAQAPVGNLRFARPVPPAGRDSVVQNGSQARTCPQAAPAWQLIGAEFATAFANGSLTTWNYTRARANAMASLSALAAAPSTPDPSVTEDCLFLDVMVPKSAFDNRNQTMMRNATGAPVLVWIYGGGYTQGSKTGGGSTNPAGLIRSSMNGSEPIIFVAMNYRLGAMGWLGGPSLQSEGGISNAALYDQRLAIQWVRERIHLFGGDPNRITLIGESAGGGSIMHQITAFGGSKGVNFQRAIIQSPGWVPTSSQWVQENVTQTFFGLLNVTSLAEARRLNSSVIMRANLLQVASSTYGQYTYGPTVDGVFVPSLPPLALINGAYAKSVSLMLGHNTNEGVFFAPAFVSSDTDFNAWIQGLLPYSAPQVVNYISNTLYPPIYDGSQNYTSPVLRATKIITEEIFTCNTHYLTRAKNGETYNYQFEPFPALHGQDVAYTFYNGQSSVFYPNIANAMQKYFVQFAATGNPNAPGYPTFPMQGNSSLQLGFNSTGIMIQTDPTANSRCSWWQKSLQT